LESDLSYFSLIADFGLYSSFSDIVMPCVA